MPFFMDATSITLARRPVRVRRCVGLAGRIQVNAALVNDPSLLVAYSRIDGRSGDPARPDFLYQRLSEHAG